MKKLRKIKSTRTRLIDIYYKDNRTNLMQGQNISEGYFNIINNRIALQTFLYNWKNSERNGIEIIINKG